MCVSKVIGEKLLVTFPDLKWPWWHDEGSSVAIFRLKVSMLPVTRCLSVSIGFLQKEAHFIFLPLPYVYWRGRNIDPILGHRYQNSEIEIVHIIGNDITRWKFQSLNIQTFFFRRWGHLTWPVDLTLNDMDLHFTQTVWAWCIDRCTKDGVDVRRRSWDNYLQKKNFRGVIKHPRPGMGRGDIDHDEVSFRHFRSELTSLTPPQCPLAFRSRSGQG